MNNIGFIISFSLGVFICLYYLMFVFLYSYFKTPKGYIWTPINDQLRFPGDSRVYAACVQEARSNFFKYKHPISNDIERIAMDQFRVTSYRLAAILGFFIPDERWAYLVSFTLGVLSNFALVYFTGFLLGLTFTNCLILGLVVVFGLGVGYYIFSFRSFAIYIFDYLLNMRGLNWLEKFNDNFRYVIMNTANIFIWLNLLICIKFSILVNSWPGILLLFLYCLIVPFIYPVISIVFYFLTGLVLLIEMIYSGEYYNIIIYFSIVGCSLIILLFMGFWNKIKSGLSDNKSGFYQIHITNNKSDDFKSSLIIFLIWILPLILIAFSNIFILKIKIIVIALSIIIFILNLYGIVKKNTYSVKRIIWRGIMHYWFFFIILYIMSYFQKLDFPNQWILNIPLKYVISYFVLCVIALILIFNSSKMAIRHYISRSFFIKYEQWAAYQFIKKSIPINKYFLAINYSDLQLIPVFTHANLYLRGAEWLESSHLEIQKLIGTFHLLDINPNIIKEWLTCYFSKTRDNKPFLHKLRPSNVEFYEVTLLDTLLYYPYFTHFDNVLMYDKKTNFWTNEFLEKIQAYIEMPMEKLYFNIKDVDYIILTKREEELRIAPNSNPVGFLKVFSNTDYSIYKKV